MKIVALIFARGGSKGFPGKNIRSFCGKPMIAWSIEQALAIERIERVIVSTDSEEIADISRKFGAEVPFIRPAHLATDSSPELLAWRHALEYLKEKSGSMPETMVSLPPTSPLRSIIDVNNCLDLYENTLSDVIITVTNSRRNPYFNMVTLNSDGTYGLVNPPASRINRRQDAPVVYDMTTVCYVVNSEFITTHDSIFEGRVGAINVPFERAIDIDTYVDFQIAEALFASGKEK